MKRLWASLAIFLVLIGGCIVGIRCTKRISQETARIVAAAKAAQEQGDSGGAYGLSRKAVENWRDHYGFLCTYIAHPRLESIDQTLAALPALCRYGAQDAFTSECDRGLAQLTYLTESEMPSAANIF